MMLPARRRPWQDDRARTIARHSRQKRRCPRSRVRRQRPRPISDADLKLMHRIDKLHLELPFAGSRMLRGLLAQEGFKVGRLHVATLMKRMGITGPPAIVRAPGPDIFDSAGCDRSCTPPSRKTTGRSSIRTIPSSASMAKSSGGQMWWESFPTEPPSSASWALSCWNRTTDEVWAPTSTSSQTKGSSSECAEPPRYRPRSII